MKTKLLSSIAALAVTIMISHSADARIWRVNKGSNYNGTNLFGNNYGGTFSNPVFKEIRDLFPPNTPPVTINHGDTIHVEGSPLIYLTADIPKRVVIIGPGYFLPGNPKTSNNGLEAKVERIDFNAGSGGSTVMGLNIVDNGNGNHAHIYIAADSITIKRCKIGRRIVFVYNSGGSGLKLITIVQNFFPNTYNSVIDHRNVLNYDNTNLVPPVDLIFNNNICQKTLLWPPNTTVSQKWNITQCNNNVFDSVPNALNLKFSVSESFRNNILASQNATVAIDTTTGSNGVITHNTGTSPLQFPTGNGNHVSPMSQVLVGTGSDDGKYQIQSSYTALYPGSDNTDRGPFGGLILSSRYTLSGLAPVPVVYEATSSGQVIPGTGLPVIIKARTIK